MDYFEPKTVNEALSLLAKYGEQSVRLCDNLKQTSNPSRFLIMGSRDRFPITISNDLSFAPRLTRI